MNRLLFVLLAGLTTLCGEHAVAKTLSESTRAKLVRSYPMDGSEFASPNTSVGLTFSVPLDPSRVRAAMIELDGSAGGTYWGTVTLSLDNRTLIFSPSRAFVLGERVTVVATDLPTADGHSLAHVQITFTVRSHAASVVPAFHSDDPMLEAALNPSAIRSDPKAANVEGLPLLTIINDDDPSDGKLYLASIGAGGVMTLPYLMILDKKANVLFSRQPGFGPVYDFVAHPNGTYSFFNAPSSTYYILDSNYKRFDTIGAANGYQTDPHELLYHPDGSYDIIAIDPIPMDLSKIVPGGDTNVIVMDNLVQEFDKAKHLVFEWRGLDHFKVTDIRNEPGTGPMPVDYAHMNALDLDADGNILISSRHLDEITKIDATTGNIIWRLGGNNNQFAFVGDSIGFSHQHSVRRTYAGTYTIFDNGNYHRNGDVFSRAVEYQLDTANKTATQVWEFRHDPPLFAQAMGSVQRMPNGNTLIGWGLNRGVAVTEVGPFKRTVFELVMDSNTCSYRAYKYPDNYVTSGLGVSSQNSSSQQNGSSLLCLPNPAQEHIVLRYQPASAGLVSIGLFDALGREVRHLFDGRVGSGQWESRIDVRSLAAGAYYVRIESPQAAPLLQQILVVK